MISVLFSDSLFAPPKLNQCIDENSNTQLMAPVVAVNTTKNTKKEKERKRKKERKKEEERRQRKKEGVGMSQAYNKGPQELNGTG